MELHYILMCLFLVLVDLIILILQIRLPHICELLIVELKYNQSADTVIRQIKEKRYQGALSGYESKILLVGISYDSEKHHTCSIEEW